MLTKRKTTSLGYAEPNEEKRIRSGKFHQPDTRFWSKEREKEPRKENPPKGERIDLLAFRRRAHSRPTHSSLYLSLSLSPSSRLHQKKKAENKKSTAAQIVAEIQSKGHNKPHHTYRFAWASTLLLEARSDPLTGLRFPPPSSLLASPVTVMSLYIPYSWLVPRMICRTAASCVSRLFITLWHSSSTARTHARVGKKV